MNNFYTEMTGIYILGALLAIASLLVIIAYILASNKKK